MSSKADKMASLN